MTFKFKHGSFNKLASAGEIFLKISKDNECSFHKIFCNAFYKFNYLINQSKIKPTAAHTACFNNRNICLSR